MNEQDFNDLFEAQEMWKEMQRDRDPDEVRDFWGGSRHPRGNPDDEEDES